MNYAIRVNPHDSTDTTDMIQLVCGLAPQDAGNHNRCRHVPQQEQQVERPGMCFIAAGG